MSILCLGFSHRTAGVALRERLAFDEAHLGAALARLGCGRPTGPATLTELVILSTCNRVELYAVALQPDFTALETFLEDVHGVFPGLYRDHVYCLQDEQAVEHLMRVAAGLDSLVLGEPQILGQVTQAYAQARRHGAVGKILGRLFQTAIHAGKRARAETAIGRDPSSISALAVRLAGQVVADIQEATVVVLGAGEMAELAVEALRTRGAARIQVINRTLERARLLAERWGGEAQTFETLGSALAQADILITSTGAPHTLIHVPDMRRAIARRPQRSMAILDIAVPRDVDPEVGHLPGVRLYDMDDLEAGLERSLSQRASEIPHVEAILAEEQASFMDFLRTLEVVPLIAEMQQQAEAIRQAELEKTLRRMPHLSGTDQERLEALTRALVKKLMHQPIITLRTEAGGPNGAEIATVARHIFGLNGNSKTGPVRLDSFHPVDQQALSGERTP